MKCQDGLVNSQENGVAAAAKYAIGRQIRDKLMSLPSKLAPQLAAENDVRNVRQLLDMEIGMILRALSDEIRNRG